MGDIRKVPFDTNTVGRCLCPGCPVQADSSCVTYLKQNLEEAIAKTPLEREEIPGVYCSTGKATCRDIDPRRPCPCGSCPIFAEYHLSGSKPVGYYCRDGASRKMD
ncbi:MAG: DUF2769 domain-containing protein [Desulfobacteraceae bacterium]|nr:MAG: DUF2769 domain-containing protein [Desulfobacteraceae bacterium]